jgi:hypothetical protein
MDLARSWLVVNHDATWSDSGLTFTALFISPFPTSPKGMSPSQSQTLNEIKADFFNFYANGTFPPAEMQAAWFDPMTNTMVPQIVFDEAWLVELCQTRIAVAICSGPRRAEPISS